MIAPVARWHLAPRADLPEAFRAAVAAHCPESRTGSRAGKAADPPLETPGEFAAQLLWQRGIRDRAALAAFVDPDCYEPASPFDFGPEMDLAVDRLMLARDRGEKVAIWGDFDADGLTATAVLWEGLGQFFPPERQLVYFIPNRLTDSHGLHRAGLESLAEAGCTLLVTCDTGSTNRAELSYAAELGLAAIVTDHHALPPERPPVAAIVNPRTLPPDHPLADLSGVAVAYKLVEALHLRAGSRAGSRAESRAESPEETRPPETLLDLVAIGLVADLVSLRGDCRYLAQVGLRRLQATDRPGVAALLQRCKRAGDRPSDIAFGLGPRINAVSRIYGDASFGVELLAGRDPERCRALADAAELANTRRQALQRDVAEQVARRLAGADWSTTPAIVLADPAWPVGVLGLVAGQVAQTYGRPTLLFHLDRETDPDRPTAVGSARSIVGLDLYDLLAGQAELFDRFGGHPQAAGLRLAAAHLPVLAAAIARELRSRAVGAIAPAVRADLTVRVADLGRPLFRELKLLEPCGTGNPVPRLLIRRCCFEAVRQANLRDWRGGKVRYIRTGFELRDASLPPERSGFPGVWWGSYPHELPPNPCDAIVELDHNSYQKRYELRLVAVRPAEGSETGEFPAIAAAPGLDAPGLTVLDWRGSAGSRAQSEPNSAASGEPELAGARGTGAAAHRDLSVDSSIESGNRRENRADGGAPLLRLETCPRSWDDLAPWLRRAERQGIPLAIAYPPPDGRFSSGDASRTPAELWTTLLGMAKYAHRHGVAPDRAAVAAALGTSDRCLALGLAAVAAAGYPLADEPDPTGTGRRLRPQGAIAGPDSDIPSTALRAEGSPEGEAETAGDLHAAIGRFLAGIREERFRQRYFYELPAETLRALYWRERAIASPSDLADPAASSNPGDRVENPVSKLSN